MDSNPKLEARANIVLKHIFYQITRYDEPYTRRLYY